MHFTPLLSKLSILTKDLTVQKFNPNWAQQEYIAAVDEQVNEGLPIRLIILKARQLGISTVTEGLMFTLAFVNERMRGLVVAHEVDASQHLLDMTHLYWETYPFRSLYTPKYKSKNQMSWVETDSSIKVATARNTKTGRSQTIHALHASEVAFWEEPETTMLGLRQTIPNTPGTMIVIESTANGVGNYFYKLWQAAESGEVEYKPLFFPWHLHPEYTASAINLQSYNLFPLDAEEKVLQRMGIGDDRLAWRRWAIANLCEMDVTKFHQEYPTTPEEAFVASGTNVFPIAKLREVYEPMEGQPGRLHRNGSRVTFQPDITGPLRIFHPPSEDKDWGLYFIGGDPTHTTTGDYACAQVINRRTYKQCAELRLKIDPMTFAEEMAKLGKYYNDAMISTEVEGPGYATIGALVEMEYPHLWRKKQADRTPGKINEQMGWSSTFRSKNLMMGFLLKLVIDKDITIHSRRLFSEMRDYVTLPDGGFGPASRSGNDDTVSSMGITCICSALEGPIMPYGLSGDTTGGGDMEPDWMSWAEELA